MTIVKSAKITLLTCVTLLMLSATALAAPVGTTTTTVAREQLFSFSENNHEAIDEINYYLQNGSTVKFLRTAAKTMNSTVIVTIVLQIPEGVKPYVLPKK